MSDSGGDIIFIAQVFFDGADFGRRFYYNKWFFGHGVPLSSIWFRMQGCFPARIH